MPPSLYFDDGQIQIWHGDCREVLPLLCEIDRVVTDPPYGVGFEGKMAKQRNGSIKTFVGGYGFDDTPDYVKSVVVPVSGIAKRLRSVCNNRSCRWRLRSHAT